MCYKTVNIPMTVGETFNFFFLRSSIGFLISVSEQKYVQEIRRVYNIIKWSHVQVVSKRSFCEKVENCIEKEKMWLDVEFSDKTDSYCNDGKTH